jgi:transposase-like protein
VSLVLFHGLYPKAAAILLEGLEETLTVHQLKVPDLLRKTLCNTNVLESANSSCQGVLR